MKGKNIIRSLYLYGVSGVAVVVMLISTIGLVQLVLNEYVFDVKSWSEIEQYWECDDNALLNTDNTAIVEKDPSLTEEQRAEKKAECIENTDAKRELQHENDVKKDFVTYFSMLIVALPLFLFHWGIVKKD